MSSNPGRGRREAQRLCRGARGSQEDQGQQAGLAGRNSGNKNMAKSRRKAGGATSGRYKPKKMGKGWSAYRAKLGFRPPAKSKVEEDSSAGSEDSSAGSSAAAGSEAASSDDE